MTPSLRPFASCLLSLALALPALHASLIGVNISEAQGYNLLTWGNASLINSSAEGRVAVGGNASFSSYSIGSSLSSANPLDAAFVVGGNLNATGGRVYNGSINVGGNYSGPGYALHSASGSVTTANLGLANLPINFAAAQSALTTKSGLYGAAEATGTSNYLWSTLTLTGTDSELNIFNIDAATLGKASSLKLDVVAGSHVLINVSGTSVTFGNMGLSGFERDNTLFNFFEASAISLSGIGIEGSILAPLADVSFFSGQVNGQLIAKSFAGASWGVGALGHHTFNNQAERPATVPDSASTAALLVMSLFVGVTAKRFVGAGKK